MVTLNETEELEASLLKVKVKWIKILILFEIYLIMI